MAAELFSDSWARAWCAELNASAVYREAAAGWEGAIVFTMAADPAVGVAATRRVYLDLDGGRCRGARAASDGDAAEAPWVFAASGGGWKRVLEGRVGPVWGLMSGQLTLARGSMVRLVPFARAATEMVKAARGIDTDFPPGWDGGNADAEG